MNKRDLEKVLDAMKPSKHRKKDLLKLYLMKEYMLLV